MFKNMCYWILSGLAGLSAAMLIRIIWDMTFNGWVITHPSGGLTMVVMIIILCLFFYRQGKNAGKPSDKNQELGPYNTHGVAW